MLTNVLHHSTRAETQSVCVPSKQAGISFSIPLFSNPNGLRTIILSKNTQKNAFFLGEFPAYCNFVVPLRETFF
jgi:hypothetical protein